MKESDIVELVTFVKVRYPRAPWHEDDNATYGVWLDILSDIPNGKIQSVVKPVLQRWFKTRRFPPDPSEIREAVLAELGLAPDGETAWRMVRERAGKWYAGKWLTDDGEAPGTLPDPVQAAYKAVGSAVAINEGTVSRDGFLKVYGACCIKYSADTDIGKALQALPAPPDIRRIG